PDRTPHTGLLNVKYTYQYLQFEQLSEQKIRIKNLHDFITTERYQLHWQVERDGKTVKQGQQSVPKIKPHSSTVVTLPICLPTECELGCHLNLSVTEKADTPWCKAGYEVAMKQFTLEVPIVKKSQLPPKSSLCITELGQEHLVIEGLDFSYLFSKRYGNFISLKKNGVELLANSTEFSVWRPAIDNERKILLCDDGLHIHDTENFNYLKNHVYELTPKEENESFVINVSGILAAVGRRPLARTNTSYTISPNGTVTVSVQACIGNGVAFLPRVGFDFTLPGGQEQLCYYGRGENENYPDMKNHAKIGLYHSTVTEQYEPYIKPQNHGTHTECKRLSVSDESGIGLLFEGENFSFTASHFSTSHLEQASHTNELIPNEETFLKIDGAIVGVGSASCGPALDQKYMLNEKEYAFTFSFTPFVK
ncbi:MAG: DUF4981 domain-containing protein, partial [Ruminococcaceae bacterium]|nr:DUF4981 domain-containing protein [Oscillospiraceae bacterium]